MEYKNFTIGQNPNPLSWFAEILEARRVYYLICIDGKGDGKDIHCSAQNRALIEYLLMV